MHFSSLLGLFSSDLAIDLGTANTLDTIPQPLLDRVEVLQVSGYSDDEKLQMSAGLHADFLRHVFVFDIDLFQADFQFAAFVLHGVVGIGAKIHDHLMNLGGISHYRGTVLIDVMHNFGRRRNRCAQQFERFLDNLLNLDGFALLAALPAER